MIESKNLSLLLIIKENIKIGAIRELNPRPPAPETGIIPLDQSPSLTHKFRYFF
jgi:hypothetical protein